MTGASIKRILPVLMAAAMLFAAGCGKKPSGDEPDAIIDIGLPTLSPAPEGTDELLPTPTPAPDTLEGRILSGLVYPLNGGEPTGLSFKAESVDLDGDGDPEEIAVSDVDGGPALTVDGEAFLDIGTKVSLASLDGKNIFFISETPGKEGFFVFHPDKEGNLFCRLYAIARKGSAEGLVTPAPVEDLIRGGLDVMLHDPLLYSAVDGAKRTVRLDMDGDGNNEEIVFDSEALSINGTEDRLILTTTMPRFVFDPERDTIVLYGSAGDTAIRLWVENGSVKFDQSYTTLL